MNIFVPHYFSIVLPCHISYTQNKRIVQCVAPEFVELVKIGQKAPR